MPDSSSLSPQRVDLASVVGNHDDAFADGDDDDLPPTFNREVVRKELERHLPPPLEPTWDDAEAEHNSASSTGAFFKKETNESVSTLDINGEPQAYAAESEWTSPTMQSPPSGHFSHIPPSAMVAVHSDTEESPSPRRSGFSFAALGAKKSTEEDVHPYPSVVIDAPTHRVTLTSESQPSYSQNHRSPSLSPSSDSHSKSSSSTSTIPAIAVVAAPVASSSISIPNASGNSHTSPPIPSSSSAPNTDPANGLTEKVFTHRSNRSSSGPSAFEKVRSKTRPVFLPPKPRSEDDKHMADWQHMMKQSRVVGEFPEVPCPTRSLRYA